MSKNKNFAKQYKTNVSWVKKIVEIIKPIFNWIATANAEYEYSKKVKEKQDNGWQALRKYSKKQFYDAFAEEQNERKKFENENEILKEKFKKSELSFTDFATRVYEKEVTDRMKRKLTEKELKKICSKIANADNENPDVDNVKLVCDDFEKEQKAKYKRHKDEPIVYNSSYFVNNSRSYERELEM
jgi:hypothetical protein